MGRKDFVTDLAALADVDIPEVFLKLRPGDDDGTICFDYASPHDGADVVSIQAMVPEVSEYPKTHTYFFYSVSDPTPASVTRALELQDSYGVRLEPMMHKLAAALNKATGSSPSESDMEPEPDGELDESDEEQLLDSDMDDAFAGAAPNPLGRAGKDDGNSAGYNLPKDKVRRIKNDLRKAKQAGFRVSCAGAVFSADYCYVGISIRVGKLGIQEDTLKAWHLDPSLYFILVIQYTRGYRTIQEALGPSPGISMRVRLSSSYRITLHEGISLVSKSAQGPSTTQPLFISQPLDDLLNCRLLDLIRHRQAHNFSWQGAEDFYQDHQGRHQGLKQARMDEKYYKVGSTLSTHMPSLVNADHLCESGTDQSLPLVAMQFALRHLVHCTEFCLVCHSRVEGSFEALKPYVCLKPLCLYQYMSLGFGPSLEHEILVQPDVVDLLVSFCYSAAKSDALPERPVGLGLLIPEHFSKVPPQAVLNPTNNPTPAPLAPTATFVLDEQKLKLKQRSGQNLHGPHIQPGKWISISFVPYNSFLSQHRLVTECHGGMYWLGPTVTEASSSPPPYSVKAMTPSNGTRSVNTASSGNKSGQEVTVRPWNTHFDDLPPTAQCSAIVSLLGLLPSVAEMKDHLKSGKTLADWTERINPASLSVLRWIIASNRSCIVQVDSLDPSVEPTEPSVTGLGEDFIQFRFAQGAPDKEQRFIDAVNDVSVKRGYKYPTIFAWHGSALKNWHSIIREGLHFKNMVNGRAFGDGVYHSLQAQTSLGYSNWTDTSWPHSRLKINNALCLSEIVNSPGDFRSSNPHLVVQFIDWIQTRYLFVKCRLDHEKHTVRRKPPIEVLDLDPGHKLYGAFDDLHESDRKPGFGYQSQQQLREVAIPITAISRSRRAGMRAHINGSHKKVKLTSHRSVAASSCEDLWASEESCDEDTAALRFDVEDTPLLSSQARIVMHSRTPTTDFVPGTLEPESLPMLPQPTYATPQASKALQRELRKVLATQAAESLHELGWSLDADLVSNMYQWIFELHSFDPALPLAADMKKLGVTSIVLEVLFGASFPYSPPFVRVVRPRFLAFQQGGGGHVTAGGAMCMELLTNSGWNPASSIEAIVLQVRMAMTSTDPQPARLEKGPVQSYSAGEAMAAYLRACRLHGWVVPEDFTVMSRGLNVSMGA